MLPSFCSSTRSFQGRPAAEVMASELQRFNAKRVLFITDRGVHAAGLTRPLEAAVPQGCRLAGVYSEVMQDPTAQLMDELGNRCRDEGIDALVAIGGGAALDAAKGAGLVASHGGSILDLVGEDKVQRPPITLLCIPTTAGTGSEVSWHISVNDTERHLKVTVRSPLAVATTAILDPQMVASVPPAVAAAAGMDALTHLLESYVGNVGRWEMTDALNLHGIQLVGDSMLPYWKNRGDERHARSMQIASCIGGLALSHSRTGIVHQMARPLGAKFHVPHGMANAVLLPWCLAVTATRDPVRFARIARALDSSAPEDDAAAAAGLADTVHRMNKTMRVPSSLAAFGVKEAELEDLAVDALQGKPAVTNPCAVSLEEVVGIYRNALKGEAHG
nr:iron-containing alcohol dehydrogenase [Parapusillimonas granuli]